MADQNTAPVDGAPVTDLNPVAPRVSSKPAAEKTDVVKALQEALAPTTEKQKRQERVAKAEAKGANEVLKGLGVKKSDRARMLEEIKTGKVTIAEARKEADAAKAQADTATAQVNALKPYQDALKEFADATFAGFPEAAQKFIAAQKVEDPIARMALIKTMRETGMIPAGAAKTAAVESKGAATTMATGNPAAPKTGATLNHFETWKALKDAGDKLGAATYRHRFGAKIDEQTPTK